jgi:redox-sensitive bicupin YhaK (pirin superfamily)
MVAPHFKMLWSEQIPKISLPRGAGEVTLIAGEFLNTRPPSPPPDSWAVQPESETLILLIRLNKNGKITLPTSKDFLSRNLYFFSGQGLKINGQTVDAKQGFSLDSTTVTSLEAADGPLEVLLLQSKPIGEPVVQYGPFVMNSKEEISQTIQDYQQSQFGGWPWDREDMVHGPKIERFAKLPNGTIERPNVT